MGCSPPGSSRHGIFQAGILEWVVFCNQIIGIMMSHDLLAKSYEQRGRNPEELAIDIENCAITLPALVPWCILITVPLAILGVGHLAVLYGVYIYAVPLITLIGKGLKRKESK